MTSIQEALGAIVPQVQGAGVVCPYCDRFSKVVMGDVIYPHRRDLFHRKFHLCEACNAYVGCHDKTGEPLGRLADAELRSLKMQAHRAFDPIWQSGQMSRSEAYSWLTNHLRPWLNGKPAHIGEFDNEMCLRTISLCRRKQK